MLNFKGDCPQTEVKIIEVTLHNNCGWMKFFFNLTQVYSLMVLFQTLTGSTSIKDEDDVTELLNAISAANESSSPPSKIVQSKPKLHKQDTDTALSSLLESLEPPPSPPESLHSVDPHEFDSQWESGYSDSDVSPSIMPNKSQRYFKSGSQSSTQGGNNPNDNKGFSKDSNDAHFMNQANMQPLDSISDNENAVSNDITDSSDDDDDDINIDDEDVFSMLRDNSQLVIGMLNNNKPSTEKAANSLEVPDVPPPIPTSPLPSDDDEPPVKPPPRRESLPKFSESNDYTRDVHYAPVMNGSTGAHDR